MAHKAAYWRLEHGWREADRIGALGAASRPGTRRSLQLMSSWRKPLAIAASLLVIVAVSLAPVRQESPELAMTRFHTAVGEQKLVTLPDGSSMQINTATVVRASVTNDIRQVWVDKGEAYFEVTHIKGRTFVVHAGSRTVTVLGTKFAVRRDGEQTTVSVIEGRVRVDDTSTAESNRSAIITAGDMAIASGPSTLLAPRSAERIENALAWRQGYLSFDNVTLGEAAAEFNRYNTRLIIITDPKTAAIRIGGIFRASNVATFVRLLHNAYGLRIENGANAVKISG
jgi:transmembrane sensor